MVEQFCEPSMYHIKPVNSNSPEQVINCKELQDLQRVHNDNDTISQEEMGKIPSFNPKARLTDDTPTNIGTPPGQKGDILH